MLAAKFIVAKPVYLTSRTPARCGKRASRAILRGSSSVRSRPGLRPKAHTTRSAQLFWRLGFFLVSAPISVGRILVGHLGAFSNPAQAVSPTASVSHSSRRHPPGHARAASRRHEALHRAPRGRRRGAALRRRARRRPGGDAARGASARASIPRVVVSRVFIVVADPRPSRPVAAPRAPPRDLPRFPPDSPCPPHSPRFLPRR